MLDKLRGCTSYDCLLHVQAKFTTPILYAIDNFKKYDFFAFIISFVYLFEIFSHLHFCSSCFSSILHHFSQKRYVLLKKSSNLVIIFFDYVIDTMYYIYS